MNEVTRLPPHNFEAEMALLGAVMANNQALDRVPFLQADHFADPRHRRIFEACRHLIELGRLANSVTLKAYFEQDKGLEGIGGTRYLARLEGSAISIINAADYASTIRDLWQRREIIGIATDLAEAAQSVTLDTDANEVATQAACRLDAVVAGVRKGAAVPLRDAVRAAIEQAEDAYRRGGALAGLSTGLTALDAALGGLEAGNLYVPAGRPSMGKTALGLTIGRNVARAGGCVLLISAEMSAEQIGRRLVAIESGVPIIDMKLGRLQGDVADKVVKAQAALDRLSFYIDDSAQPTIIQVRARARELKRRKGLDLVVVDHLHLLRGTPEAAKQGPTHIVTELTAGMKQLAKELAVPVLLLAQLNRAVEGRDDKRPILADLRQSGSIEQDADAVLLLYRASHYMREPERKVGEDDASYAGRLVEHEVQLGRARGIAHVNVAKLRDGPSGVCVRLAFDERTASFDILALGVS